MTILFKKDWNYYPTAIVDTKTKNKSFLVYAEKLRQIGVKNYAFCLALLNPSLQGKDPHAEDLDVFTMIEMRTEAKWNFWYYLRECFRVPPQASPNSLPLEANRGNISACWLFLNETIFTLIQPRQTGKSLIADAIMSWLMYVASQNTRISLLTKDNPCRESNIDRLKDIRMHLPKFLASYDKADTDNKQSITCTMLNNEYSTYVGRSSEPGARQVGRGLTSPVIQIDEGPFTPKLAITVPTMLASGSAARDEARRYGARLGTFFTTTAGKKDDESGAYMYDIVSKAAPWTERYLDLNDREQLNAVIENESRGLMRSVNCTFSHLQLGYTDEWMLSKLRENNAHGEEADRDWFNKWTSGGLGSPLSVYYHERMKKSEKEPEWLEICKHSYIIRWYKSEAEIKRRMRDRKFIAGLDTSENVGRDSSCLIIIDEKTMEVLGAAYTNRGNLNKFNAWIVDVMKRYDNMILVPERRSTASTLIDTLLIALPAEGIDPLRRIYNRFVADNLINDEKWKMLKNNFQQRRDQFYDMNKEKFGFTTAGSGSNNRDCLYVDALKRGAALCSDRIYDKTLRSEISGLEIKNNRIDHGNGHDDSVIAWLLAVWFLCFSKNLDFYGIKSALSESKESTEEEAKRRPPKPAETVASVLSQRYRARLKTLTEQLEEETDSMLVLNIENEMRALATRITDEDITTSSVDELIKASREKRTQQFRENQYKTLGGNGFVPQNNLYNSGSAFRPW